VDVERSTVPTLAFGYVCSLKADGDRAFLFDVEVIGNDIYLFDTLMYKSQNLFRADYWVELARKWYSGRGERVKGDFSSSRYRVPSRFLDCLVVLGTYRVQVKPVFPTQTVRQLAVEGGGQMTQDGLIFTQLRSTYLPYRTSMVQVLKWKPPSHLTIDVHVTSWENRPMNFHRTSLTSSVARVVDLLTCSGS
jgi:hypothetical protein